MIRDAVTIRFLLVWLTLSGSAVAAQEPASRSAPPSVRAVGEAVISARPDQAQLDVGVVTQASTAQAAAAQNAQRLDATLNQLRQALGSDAEIKTVSYAVTPNYRYPKEGGNPTIAGYTATNIVRVTINDLAQVGRVIDVASQSGANQIQRLLFTLRDEQAVRTQALREAAARARAKAEAIAAALGVRVTRVLLAEESSPPIARPLAAEAMARTDVAAVPTPIEPGVIEVRATVALTVEIAPRHNSRGN